MDTKTKQIKPMMCPVCGRFYFSKLNEDRLKAGEMPNDVQCSHCGWYYDLEQTKDPHLEKQANEMSLTEYKEWYKKKIAENPKWDYFEEHMPPPEPHMCPVCGEYEFQNEYSYDICPICGWEDSGFEDFPDEQMSISSMTFNENVKWFREQRAKDPNFWAFPEDKKRKMKFVKKK